MDATLLIDMIRTLRGPGGCPWDQKQELADLRPYLIEEAHEAATALDEYVDALSASETGDRVQPQELKATGDALCAELGDLLFQLCFVAELARTNGAFEPRDVAQRVHDKMVERHPHVYGDEELATAAEVAKAWEQRKARQQPEQSILAGVPRSLPALTAAYRTGQKAAGIGFDWPELTQVRAKVAEELRELDQAIAAQIKTEAKEPEASVHKAAVEEELGDLLLSISSLARHLEIDPERALSRANIKFRRRFQHIEKELDGADLEQAERLWQKAKREIG